MRGVRAVVAIGIFVVLVCPGAAWAQSCAASTARALYAVSDVVFDGVAVESGPTTLLGTAVSFSVDTWHKRPAGHTPAGLTVATRTVGDDTSSPRAGEIWRVYAAATPQGTYVTSACAGTHRLASLAEPLPFAGPGAGFTGALAAVTAGIGVRRRLRRLV